MIADLALVFPYYIENYRNILICYHKKKEQKLASYIALGKKHVTLFFW